MSTQDKETKKEEVAVETNDAQANIAVKEEKTDNKSQDAQNQKAKKGSFKPRAERKEREENPYIEKVINIRRVTKVTKGGKNLNFTALVVVGDGKGKAGYALGKAPEVAEAIRKAMHHAKKKMYDIPVENTTIPHEMVGRYSSTRVLLMPGSQGTGIIACLPVRAIAEAAGIGNILTKVMTRSSNPINIVKATFEGLTNMKV